ncbi:hypothetical protein [Streptomyces litchfieldiae]|uniref:Uncharacterized protein n=1 Tax=Streptomyces litchfieldiae TaxID=3075543 RepID=A0ABU2MJN8_9ACTN|nr:hypothetical protein [Streptomyces sp. DSM 44938]MDT0341578.1 hypothetical protein [Streptomyces sp. DSM 44938]
MALRFVGIDPETGGGNCPAVWVDDEKQEIVLQGWKADGETTARTRQDSPLPNTEAVIRLPYRMIDTVRKALDEAGS